MMHLISRVGHDQSGTTTIEFSIVMVLFFMLTFGLVEFGYALFQWNTASKAAQIGARMAAVSNPVWTGLLGLTDSGTPGGPWTTAYDVTCTGTNATGSAGECAGASAEYDAVAMQDLVFGRGDTTCGTIGTDSDPGMCDVFNRITPENVNITYENTGLGFAGRPGGPVPTITLTVSGLTYEFIGLGGLLGFSDITMPDFTVTMTGEDLSGAAVP